MKLPLPKRTGTWIAAGFALTLAVGVAVVLVVGLAGCSHQESSAQAPSGQQPTSVSTGLDRPVPVKVVRPTREHLKRVSRPQPAHVEPYEKTDRHAMVSGYVEVIGPALDSDGKPILDKDGKPRPLDIGDRVKKGQVLAELWVPELKQELAQKAALVGKARADLGQVTATVQAAKAMVEETSSLVAKYDADVTYRKGEYKRYRDLYEQKAVQGDVVDKEFNLLRAAEAAFLAAHKAVVTSQKNVQVKQADEKAAEARVKVAEADLQYRKIMVDYATIKSPYDGVLTRRLVDTGTFVQSAATGKATPLFSVARVDRLRIVAEIPEAEAGLVKIGQPASFHPNGFRGQSLSAKVVRFADALDSGTRTMRVELELDAPATTLRPGMFGSGTITLVDFPEALTLPATALVAGKSPSVLCVEDGLVYRREVEIGFNDGVRMQISKGLLAGANVITDGKVSVREGQAVEIAK